MPIPDPAYTPWTPRYSMIDAWRGLAALGVACHHLGHPGQYNTGHICVMVFFVISGYCIAAATVSCQENGLGFGAFMWRRFRRIYPPYFFALCFFFVTRLIKLRVGLGDQISSSAVVWIENLTLTQWLHLLSDPPSYAAWNAHLFVAAFWSLNYEEQFYLAMGLLMLASAWCRRPLLWGVMVLAVPAFIINIYYPSTSFGLLVDYWVHFGLGIMVYYRLCKLRSKLARSLVDLSLLVLVLFCILRWPNHSVEAARSVYFEWTIAGTFALLLIVLRRWDASFKTSWIGVGLCSFGLITYSLYLTHQFNLRVAFTVSNLLLAPGVAQLVNLPIELATLAGIATVFWYFCERPFLNPPLKQPVQSTTSKAAVAATTD